MSDNFWIGSIAAFVFSWFVAWATHIIVCIMVLASGTSSALGYGILLIVGTIFFPIGIVHGYGIWFGAW